MIYKFFTGTLLVCLIFVQIVSSGPLTENDVNEAFNNPKKALEDSITEVENYFESVQGKKCQRDSDCASISYCDAFSGESITETTGDFECKINIWFYLVVVIIAMVLLSSLCSCICCPCCCVYKCIKSCCC